MASSSYSIMAYCVPRHRKLCLLGCLLLICFIIYMISYDGNGSSLSSALQSRWAANGLTFKNVPIVPAEDPIDSHPVPTRQHTDKIKNVPNSDGPTKRSPKPNKQAYPFQSIDDNGAWVYSAFYDQAEADGGNPRVRAMAVVNTSLLGAVNCDFESNGGHRTSVGKIIPYPDTHGVRMTPAHIDCSLEHDERPKYVTFSIANSKRTTANQLPILYPPARSRNFTVCYAVLHSGYSTGSRLIQSIEINRILGAEHFMLYNLSISPKVDKIISRYQAEGLLTVHQWPLPTKESWYYAQITAVNDCLYRNRGISQFVAFHDTDEVIMPRKHKNWMDLINSLELQLQKKQTAAKLSQPKRSKPNDKQHQIGVFLFRSTVFGRRKGDIWGGLLKYISYTPEERRFIHDTSMNMMSEFWHVDYIYPERKRTKYIVRPEQVLIAGIHTPVRLTTDARMHDVSAELALLHHHRWSGLEKTVLDTDLYTYKAQLIPRLLNRIRQFPNIYQTDFNITYS